MPTALFNSFIYRKYTLLALLVVLGIIVLSMQVNCFAQFDEFQTSRWSVRNWQLDDGLPDNRISGIAQTKDGYLWIATRGGLTRFNGTEFEAVPLKHETGVVFNGYTSMLAASNGAHWLWMSTFRETLLRISRDEFKIYTHADGVPTGELMGMADDKSSEVYFLISGHLYSLTKDHIDRIKLKDPYKDTLSTTLILDENGVAWCSLGKEVGTIVHGVFTSKFKVDDEHIVITKAKLGGLWVCSGSHLLRYSEAGILSLEYSFESEILPKCLMEDSLGAVWLGTDAHGLIRFDGNAIEYVATSQHAIRCILEDHEGNIWAGTASGGLNRLRLKALEFVGRKSGMPFESTISVCVDTSKTSWVVTGSGQVLNNEFKSWKEVPLIQKMGALSPTAIIADQAGYLWLGTRGQGLKQINVSNNKYKTWNKGSGLTSDTVRALYLASDDSLWFSTDEPACLNHIKDEKLTVYKTPSDVRNIRSITETPDHVIYFGTSEGRVFNIRNNKVQVDTAIEVSSSRSVRCLAATADGSLWIGYSGAGLGHLKDGNFRFITTKDGLVDNSIWQIVTDYKNNLWVASSHGISRFTRKDLQAFISGNDTQLHPYIFGSQDGLRGFQAQYGNAPTACVDRAGNVSFSTNLGLVVAHPDRINNNPIVPEVVIESVTLDDRLYKLNDNFKLKSFADARSVVYFSQGKQHIDIPSNYSKLFITFSALEYSAPEKIRYRYRLDGLDGDWNELGLQKNVILPQLGPGEYVFKVSACNEMGVWNQTPTVLVVSVGHFFWQTLWFEGIIILSFTGIVIGIVRIFSFRRLKKDLIIAEQKTALLSERARIARDIHDDVGGSLSQIKLISEIAQQYKPGSEQSEESLKQITTTATDMLKSLDEIVWAINPKNDNLPNLISYIGQYCVEKLRNGGVKCLLNLPEYPSEIGFSSEVRHNLFLVVKEAITNILKHASATTVWIEISGAEEHFKIVIRDDGKGFDFKVQATSGDGVLNMAQRLQVIGGQFLIQSVIGKGTTIEISVPV